MREYAAEPAGDLVHELGEGPRWDDVSQTVSWVDIARGRVFRGVLDGTEVQVTETHEFPATTGAAVPTTDGGLLVAAHDRLVAVAPDGTRISTAPLIDADDALRLNDAAVDPAGRFLLGSLATDHRAGAGALLRLEDDGTASVVRDGLTITNGIGWSPDGGTIYLADSLPGTLWSAPYDVATGEVGPWKALVTEFGGGLPDGLCVDTDGRIWLAVWNGAQVRCYSPAGEPLAVVTVPVPHVTATAFVGPVRDRLLVTSSRDELEPERRRRFPLSGRLFSADVGAVGLPTNRWSGSASRPGWTHVTP